MLDEFIREANTIIFDIICKIVPPGPMTIREQTSATRVSSRSVERISRIFHDVKNRFAAP